MKKIDKDALLKQKFWILVGVFTFLWIICLSFVVVNAGGPVEEAQKNFATAKAAVGKYPRPKNASFLPAWVKYGETFTKHKNEIWKMAWRAQGEIYDWPSDQDHPLNSVLRYPSSPFETSLREWYRTKEAYGKQFANVKLELQPDQTPPKGQPPYGPLGAVVFKDGYDNVMKPIDFASINRTPDAEECWLAQEDFWVKRELLYVVSDAMSMAARLDPVADAEENDKAEAPAKDAKGAKGSKYLGRQVFRNASWEVTLLFDKDKNGRLRISPDSRIKNIHVSHREQTLGNPAVPIDGAFFLLRQGDAKRQFYFQGEKVPWGKERLLGTDDGFQLSSIDPNRPAELEQVFDRGDTPVASIDEIRIPYVSDRNANRTLVAAKPERFGNKAAAADAAQPAAPVGVPGLTPGLPTMPGGSAMPGGSLNGSLQGKYAAMQNGGTGGLGGQGGTSTGAQPSSDPTPNISLDRDRYLFVTDQSRHLPLAMTLTVDQSSLSDILVALANSRLRFQTTQVEFRRQPAGAGGEQTTGMGFPRPGGTAMSRFPAKGEMPLTPRFRPSIPGPLGAADATVTTPTLENPNLVEVTIYGVASLYERPPEDKK